MDEIDEVHKIDEEIELNRKFQFLSAVLPNADFDFIRMKCLELVDRDEEFESFVSETLMNMKEEEDAPPKVNEARNFLINTSSLESLQYSLEAFVHRFKDPIEYFHKCPKGPDYKDKMVEYLKDRFRNITTERIEEISVENDYNLVECILRLEDTPPDPVYFNEVPRTDEEIKKYINDGEDDFLYEVEFVKHKEEILDFMKIKQDEKEAALEKAKILGELLECECCSDQEVLAEEVVTCENGHVFCSECFQRSVEVIMGDAKVEFPCFQECNGKFPMSTVKKVLTIKAYEKLMSRIQYREVRAAEVPGMEFCPFCEYGAIPAENDELFRCEKCLIDVCRRGKYIAVVITFQLLVL
ncbi:uncharacterized protein isoform X2 [Rhodnius prolixus]|uniref:uncharacterized protein isoform X2 n=1 Tax=Rhodnius prolixus TaxID=13249 RepID=UPI003D18E34F